MAENTSGSLLEGIASENVPFFVLYSCGKSIKRLYAGSAGQNCIVETCCGVSPRNHLCTAVLLIDPVDYRRVGVFFVSSSMPNDIFSTYRAMKLLHLMPEIDCSQTIMEALIAASPGAAEPDIEILAVESIIKKISKERYWEIMRMVPPCLEDAATILMRNGIMLHWSTFEKEIRAGTIKFENYMRLFGVEDPQTSENELMEQERQIARYWENASKYLLVKDLSKDYCFAEEMRKQIMICVHHGITAPDILFGVAAVRAEQNRKKLINFAALKIQSMLGMPDIPDIDMKFDIADVSQYLFRAFGSMTVDGYAEELTRILEVKIPFCPPEICKIKYI